MINKFTVLLLCYLTSSAVAYDLQQDKIVTVEKGQRIQVIHTKDNKTIFAIKYQYFQIDNDKLICR